jgi:hypothetical protein
MLSHDILILLYVINDWIKFHPSTLSHTAYLVPHIREQLTHFSHLLPPKQVTLGNTLQTDNHSLQQGILKYWIIIWEFHLCTTTKVRIYIIFKKIMFQKKQSRLNASSAHWVTVFTESKPHVCLSHTTISNTWQHNNLFLTKEIHTSKYTWITNNYAITYRLYWSTLRNFSCYISTFPAPTM